MYHSALQNHDSSPRSKIGRQIVIFVIVRFLILLLGFVGVKYLTNSLSISTYGIYSLIFITIAILSACLELGFRYYLISKVPGERKTKGFSYFTTNFLFKLILVSAVVILTISIGIPLVRYFNLNISSQIIILSAFILMFSLLLDESCRFHGLRKRLEFTAVMSLFKEKLWILPIFFFWWFFREITLDQILLIRICPLILLLFISLWFMKKKGERIGDNKIFDIIIIREGFVFGAPLIILAFGHYLLISADRYIVAFLLSTTAVGYYSLVYTLIYIGHGLTSSINSASGYHFAEAYNLGKKDDFQFSKAKNIFNCSLKLSLIVSLFLCVIFAFLRSPLIQIFSRKEYLIAAPAMLILSLFPVLLILTTLLQGPLVLEKQRGTLTKGWVLALLLNIILNFILIPKFGINGAAVATVVSYLFIFLFFLSRVKKYHILEFPKLQLLKLGICLLFAITPIYFLNPVSIIQLLYSGIISGVVYLTGLFVLKVITKKDWNILFSSGVRQINEYIYL